MDPAPREEPKDDTPRMDPDRKGSDRGKLQSLRVKLNCQINRELRLRNGAENLLRATSNPKVKQTVALELSFVNSNLQLLKEELEELNSCMDPYQDHSESLNVPMIPLGLKETKEVDFSLCIKDIISEHYGEDGSEFEAEIQELNQLRESVRTPSRSELGLDLLLQYYNQLYYLDQRFCKPHSHLGVLFHWYDSLTGVPSSQKAMAFEKGSVLFNIGALFTQIGAKQDRSDPQGIDLAIAAYRRAAGAFMYLRETFCNAPSLDMSELSLWTLQLLMTAQAQECVLERTARSSTTATLPLLQATPTPHQATPTAQNAPPTQHQNTAIAQQTTATPHQTTPTPHQATPTAQNAPPTPHQDTTIAQQTTPTPHQTTPTPQQATSTPHQTTPTTQQAMPTTQQVTPTIQQVTPTTHQTTPTAQQATPPQLLRLAQETAQVAQRYRQVAQSMAQPLMKNYVPFSWWSMVQVKLQHFMALSHYYSAQALRCYGDDHQDALLQFYSHCNNISVHLMAAEGRLRLCKSHLRAALMMWEESLRLHSLCKVLRKMDVLQSVLSSDHSRALDQYSDLDQEDDFEETRDAPPVHPQSDLSPDPVPPDFSSVQVQDLFHRLGPLCVFSARAQWGPQRTVVLPQTGGSALGLTLRGDAPVLVTAVQPGGAAQEAGLREGDYIVAVNGVDTKWSNQKEVVELLLRSSEEDMPPTTSPVHQPQRGPVVSVVSLHSEQRPQMSRSRSDADIGRREKENSAPKRSVLNWPRPKPRRQCPSEPRPLTSDPSWLY